MLHVNVLFYVLYSKKDDIASFSEPPSVKIEGMDYYIGGREIGQLIVQTVSAFNGVI